MKRKILAVFLALCMSMSLVACNGGGTSSTTSGSTESGAEASGTTAETPENFNAEGMPIVNEEITVDTWVEGGTDIDWANTAWSRKLPRNPGADGVTAVSGADSVTQRNLRLASGDYPELFLLDWTSILTFTDIMQYGVQEQVLAPIDEYIELYGENMPRIFEDHPDYQETVTATDGHIYGFPRFSECYHCLAYPKFYIRQDWLDALNLDMPTNTDELKEVLHRFQSPRSPNGNGQADEIACWAAPIST